MQVQDSTKVHLMALVVVAIVAIVIFKVFSTFVFTSGPIHEQRSPRCASFNALSDPDFKFGNERPPLFESSATALHLQPALLERYGMGLPQLTQCFYSAIFPKFEPYEHDHTIKNAICKNETGIQHLPLALSVRVPSYIHLARLFCYRFVENRPPRIVYNDFAGFIHRNDAELRARCDQAETCAQRREMASDWLLQFNVIVIGVDAGSRLNRKRNLVQTHEVLTKLLDAVADSSSSSFASVAAGMTVAELQDNCWRESDSKGCPTFLWEVFSERGFATAFVEDPQTEKLRDSVGKMRRSAAVDYFGSPLIHGKAETTNPFAYIYLPKTFRDTYPSAFKAVKTNAKRLVTPFDVHSMLLSLADPVKYLTPYAVTGSVAAKHDFAAQQGNSKVPAFYIVVKGRKLELSAATDNHEPKRQVVSLFDPITETRTCHQAGILPSFCMCAPYFGLMWLHSATNVDMNALRLLDQPLAAALRDMHTKKLLERTVVVVVAGRGSGNANPGFKSTAQRRAFLSKTDFVVAMANEMLTYINDALELQTGCSKLELSEIMHAELQQNDAAAFQETVYLLRIRTWPGKMLVDPLSLTSRICHRGAK
ncbi:hypothetical protein B566_EDAN012260 [Ephemera danica]|nr:hypothetical protein B566_EDAN012260 [Ephemera danica]